MGSLNWVNVWEATPDAGGELTYQLLLSLVENTADPVKRDVERIHRLTEALHGLARLNPGARHIEHIAAGFVGGGCGQDGQGQGLAVAELERARTLCFNIMAAVLVGQRALAPPDDALLPDKVDVPVLLDEFLRTVNAEKREQERQLQEEGNNVLHEKEWPLDPLLTGLITVHAH